jgi:hypothetical protein
MTPEEERLILDLAIAPGRESRISPDDFLNRFGTGDGKSLGLHLLRGAVDRHNGADVELALIVCFTFGFTEDHVSPLLQLVSAEWHVKHEDVVTALGILRAPAAVDALFHAATYVPSYLEYDETRALATKAVRALGRTQVPKAEEMLRRLAASEDDMVSKAAKAELISRLSGPALGDVGNS